jgi:hypothetical protein
MDNPHEELVWFLVIEKPSFVMNCELLRTFKHLVLVKFRQVDVNARDKKMIQVIHTSKAL